MPFSVPPEVIVAVKALALVALVFGIMFLVSRPKSVGSVVLLSMTVVFGSIALSGFLAQEIELGVFALIVALTFAAGAYWVGRHSEAEPVMAWLEAHRERVEGNGKYFETKFVTREAELRRFECAISLPWPGVSRLNVTRAYLTDVHPQTLLAVIYSLASLLLGWWSIPRGPVYVVRSISGNFRGAWSTTVGELYDSGTFDRKPETRLESASLIWGVLIAGVGVLLLFATPRLPAEHELTRVQGVLVDAEPRLIEGDQGGWWRITVESGGKREHFTLPNIGAMHEGIEEWIGETVRLAVNEDKIGQYPGVWIAEVDGRTVLHYVQTRGKERELVELTAALRAWCLAIGGGFVLFGLIRRRR